MNDLAKFAEESINNELTLHVKARKRDFYDMVFESHDFVQISPKKKPHILICQNCGIIRNEKRSRLGNNYQVSILGERIYEMYCDEFLVWKQLTE